MKKSTCSRLVLTLGCLLWGSVFTQAQEMPRPTKEHELLSQFAGEWEVSIATSPLAGETPIRCEGKEVATMLGGFWLVGQGDVTMDGTSVRSILTLGYDPDSLQYVGTFVCSASSTLWEYSGELDDSGKKLVLTTEGPSLADPSLTVQYQETLELVDPDHKVFTSSMQAAEGKWIEIVSMKYKRIK